MHIIPPICDQSSSFITSLASTRTSLAPRMAHASIAAAQRAQRCTCARHAQQSSQRSATQHDSGEAVTALARAHQRMRSHTRSPRIDPSQHHHYTQQKGTLSPGGWLKPPPCCASCHVTLPPPPPQQLLPRPRAPCHSCPSDSPPARATPRVSTPKSRSLPPPAALPLARAYFCAPGMANL